ncbi:MAG: HaeIII family restriction endonuclease, partial [Geitlerinemataceae cyanobacterium]
MIKSNQQGRALEYAIVEELVLNLPSDRVTLSSRTLQDQLRDLPKYISLADTLKNHYQRGANCIIRWLESEFSISRHFIEIDRLPDRSSNQGDVTDIRISSDSFCINLSVKHNNQALKHQRPASTAQHCGYPKASPEDFQFRHEYHQIIQDFLQISQGYDLFRDLEPGVILDFLYTPICLLVANFISSFCKLPWNANHLFTFLTGNTNFYKVILPAKQDFVKIQEFTHIPPVESVVAESDRNYVYLKFSNDWQMALRLHTASSRIQQNPSLKFDTQP